MTSLPIIICNRVKILVGKHFSVNKLFFLKRWSVFFLTLSNWVFHTLYSTPSCLFTIFFHRSVLLFLVELSVLVSELSFAETKFLVTLTKAYKVYLLFCERRVAFTYLFLSYFLKDFGFFKNLSFSFKDFRSQSLKILGFSFKDLGFSFKDFWFFV